MSLDPPLRQTQSFLSRRLEEVGIRPYGGLGQNFLVDWNLQLLLVRTADLTGNDVVLEVGTGTGALTALLAQQAAAVVTVEVDPQLFRLASEELERLPNVTMLQTDILKNKNRLNQAVLEAVAEKLAAAPGRQLKLAANLPFNVATPVVSNLLALDRPPATMTVTIQREVAERITAQPRTKDYGSLSLWIQSQCRTELVRILPPQVFWPRPKVSSAILHIVLDETLCRRIPDREFFHDFLRRIFLHRRKLLRSGLLSVSERLDKPAVDQILGQLGFKADARAEQLDVEQMLALCAAVQAVSGG